MVSFSPVRGDSCADYELSATSYHLGTAAVVFLFHNRIHSLFLMALRIIISPGFHIIDRKRLGIITPAFIPLHSYVQTVAQASF